MINIRRMGIDGTHGSNFEINRPNGYDCYLFLYLKTKALFCISGIETISKPDSYVLFKPNTPHIYRACENEYINDWIQFDSDSDPFGISLNSPVHIGNSVSVSLYMRLICDAFYRNNSEAYDGLMKALFSELSLVSENNIYKGLYYPVLAGLRKEIYDRPDIGWTIKVAANRLNISEPYLQELYKKAFGVAIGADIIESRIQTAMELLRYTEMSITEIAFKCGYNSTVHFSRQFSGIMGKPPLKWRQHVRSI